MNAYLAIDLGAESGRAVIGTVKDQKIELQEIHRFPNRLIMLNGHQFWDFPYLMHEIKQGIRKAIQKTQIKSIGVDTWGVDFGLLDKKGNLIGNPYGYRDVRTEGMMERAFEQMPQDELFNATGNQFLTINTVFQLLSMKEGKDPQLDIAENLLFMPDLINYFLTGEKSCEYTIASTSQMMDSKTGEWSDSLFNALDLPQNLVEPIVHPGTKIGMLQPSVKQEIGVEYDIDVVAVGAHDTASAITAIPAVEGKEWAFLSSGTWSLLGIELQTPIVTKEVQQLGFTNEGGVNQTITFLKNITGLWLLQQCKRVWEAKGDTKGYGELVELAKKAKPFQCIIHPNDPLFTAPSNMLDAIQQYCEKTQQPAPDSQGGYVRVICESLALYYGQVFSQLKKCTKKDIEVLHVIGGGGKNEMLNQFTANALNIPVIAGPYEATALGNIIVQATTYKEVASASDARRMVANNFSSQTFFPQDTDVWNDTDLRS